MLKYPLCFLNHKKLNTVWPLNSFANAGNRFANFFPFGEHKLSQSEFTSFPLLQDIPNTHAQ